MIFSNYSRKIRIMLIGLLDKKEVIMNEITIRTNNSVEGVKKIAKLWQDVMSGNTPLLLAENTKLISKYSNYASDETGDYDFEYFSSGS